MFHVFLFGTKVGVICGFCKIALQTACNPIAADIVDWVKVELIGTANTSIIGTRACLLRNDGQIIDPTDSSINIKFENISVGVTSGYVAVHHRNHLAVMNGTAVSF